MKWAKTWLRNTWTGSAKGKIIRLAICLGPGMVLSRLAEYPVMPVWLKTVGSGTLGIGLLVYFLWDWAKRQMDKRHSGASGTTGTRATMDAAGLNGVPAGTVNGAAVDGAVYVKLMDELSAMKGNDAGRALALVAQELRVQPGISYPMAIELAHRRAALASEKRRA